MREFVRRIIEILDNPQPFGEKELKEIKACLNVIKQFNVYNKPFYDNLTQAGVNSPKPSNPLDEYYDLYKRDVKIPTTALARAVMGSFHEIAKMLLEAGADPNKGELHQFSSYSRAAPDTVRTPLMNAAASGDRDMVCLLLKFGANPRILYRSYQASYVQAIDFTNDKLIKDWLRDPSLVTQPQPSSSPKMFQPVAVSVSPILPVSAPIEQKRTNRV
jgi:hypothetical protein